MQFQYIYIRKKLKAELTESGTDWIVLAMASSVRSTFEIS